MACTLRTLQRTKLSLASLLVPSVPLTPSVPSALALVLASAGGGVAGWAGGAVCKARRGRDICPLPKAPPSPTCVYTH